MNRHVVVTTRNGRVALPPHRAYEHQAIHLIEQMRTAHTRRCRQAFANGVVWGLALALAVVVGVLWGAR